MRISYWDNWKGIAIIAVVAIHASSGTETFQESSFNWIFGLTLRQMIDFAVPIFLAMSGYFAEKSSKMPLASFYRSRFVRILIPYLIWTAIFLAIKTPTEAPSPIDIFKGVFFGTAIVVGYFVIVLIQFVVITPLLSKIDKPSSHLAIMTATSIIGTVFIYYFTAFNPDHLISKFPAYALPFFVWYPFYHAGFFVSRYSTDMEIGAIFRKTLIFCAAASLLLSMAEGLYWAHANNYSFGASQLKASSMLASMFIFLSVVAFKDHATLLSRHSYLTWLGANSYAIYLMHMLFLPLIQRTLMMTHDLQPIFILSSTAITLILCTGLIKLFQSILPTYSTKYILGN